MGPRSSGAGDLHRHILWHNGSMCKHFANMWDGETGAFAARPSVFQHQQEPRADQRGGVCEVSPGVTEGQQVGCKRLFSPCLLRQGEKSPCANADVCKKSQFMQSQQKQMRKKIFRLWCNWVLYDCIIVHILPIFFIAVLNCIVWFTHLDMFASPTDLLCTKSCIGI